MKRIPRKFNSEKQEDLLVLSLCADKLGKVFYCVKFLNYDGKHVYVTFKHLSSVLDFIHHSPYFK